VGWAKPQILDGNPELPGEEANVTPARMHLIILPTAKRAFSDGQSVSQLPNREGPRSDLGALKPQFADVVGHPGQLSVRLRAHSEQEMRDVGRPGIIVVCITNW
jgi:hypothetical protein